MAASDISHRGKIVEINPDFITVEIVAESACATCHAANLCGTADATHKAISVRTTLGDWKIGQEVLVLLSSLLGLNALGMGELASGLASIGLTALYYLVLWLLRDRLKNEYSFYIKEI